MKFMNELRSRIKPVDMVYLNAQRAVPTPPVWDNTLSDEVPAALRKPVDQMSDAEIQQFADWCHEKQQSMSLGVQLSAENIDVFWEMFECQRCGRCCVGPLVGGIEVMPSEIRTLAERAGVKPSSFRRLSTLWHGQTREMPFPCQFHRRLACAVYDDRPVSCRSFPLDMTIGKAAGELAVQAVCPAARDLFVELTKQRRELMGSRGGRSWSERRMSHGK